MKAITINNNYTQCNIPEKIFNELEGTVKEETKRAFDVLTARTGAGNDFLGWIDLPDSIDEQLITKIQNDVNRLKDKVDVVVAIGIGGSYLGAKAIVEALKPASKETGYPELIFAGCNLNGLYISNLLKLLDDKDYCVIVISKSGTTTEPAISFRLLKQHLENKYGTVEAASRIIAITDGVKGTLHGIATANGYSSYVIPDNVGGRFSVLTPVGLVPVAFAGYDIRSLIEGAKVMRKICLNYNEDNVAVKYAFIRHCLHQYKYNVEVFVNYLDHLNYISEWWKQLYGESEGKDEKGIFPASVSFTTDLHSLGQFIQGGSRLLYETVLNVENIAKDVTVPFVDDDVDGLNYIAGKSIHEVNKTAMQATIEAHSQDGCVPNIIINVPEINEFYLGQLLYMFEFACGISGYMFNVNPFNQPDVEAYKKNMFRLLGKK
ncbi:MAG: glucose-6-phosphate isomerase [Bacteroidales bacterium]|jgi:glucose-6-phosphate isomerase|nr:glucose-6-phosphate isomerase [Bacteroidales bacterium]MDD2205291.1 glucose-6-phosphate isomerase [Bacteroidales bacterium]MDD3151707.1 glucose-6-phosphate isomerase [Bacteroidales bacterium]MDD3914259.1 glucose-6-phosphate isomerase [Bacteroidales bacterium]MDD4633426.1 glucose-6-phosphate isomerase [Bacteroidales bacterium]